MIMHKIGMHAMYVSVYVPHMYTSRTFEECISYGHVMCTRNATTLCSVWAISVEIELVFRIELHRNNQ